VRSSKEGSGEKTGGSASTQKKNRKKNPGMGETAGCDGSTEKKTSETRSFNSKGRWGGCNTRMFVRTAGQRKNRTVEESSGRKKKRLRREKNLTGG